MSDDVQPDVVIEGGISQLIRTGAYELEPTEFTPRTVTVAELMREIEEDHRFWCRHVTRVINLMAYEIISSMLIPHYQDDELMMRLHLGCGC